MVTATNIARLPLRPTPARPEDPLVADLRAEVTRLRFAHQRRGRLLRETRRDMARARREARDRAWWLTLAALLGGTAVALAPAVLRAMAVVWRLV